MTVGGSTSGRATTASTTRAQRPRAKARRQASGVATSISTTTVLAASSSVVRAASQSAGDSMSGDAIAGAADDGAGVVAADKFEEGCSAGVVGAPREQNGGLAQRRVQRLGRLPVAPLPGIVGEHGGERDETEVGGAGSHRGPGAGHALGAGDAAL